METENQMLKAEFSSPCKIILTGEHAVVYGIPAITIAAGPPADYDESTENNSERCVAGRTKCRVAVYENHKRERSFFRIKTSIFEVDAKTLSDLDDLEQYSEYQQMSIKVFLNSIKAGLKTADGSDSEEIIKAKLQAIATRCAFSFEIDFAIPVGAGLGSSASFNSAFGGATFLITKQLISSKDGKIPAEVKTTSEDIEEVKALTDFGEKLAHGNPSGIDSFIITKGGIVKFTKMDDGTVDFSDDLELPDNFNFDIVFTGVHRNTKRSLDNMLKLKESFPGK